MKALHVDFAPTTLMRTLSRVSFFTWLQAIFSLTACLIFAFDSVSLWKKQGLDQAKLNQLIAQQHERLGRIPLVKKESVTSSEINAVNAVAAQLNLPWRDLFDAIERATPTDIALLSLEPDAGKQTMKGSAESKDLSGMIDYIASLQQQDFLSDVELLRHEINEADTHKPVRFQFSMQWQSRVP